jgi:hypothetical protein
LALSAGDTFPGLGTLCAELEMSRQAVTKHLDLLETGEALPPFWARDGDSWKRLRFA